MCKSSVLYHSDENWHCSSKEKEETSCRYDIYLFSRIVKDTQVQVIVREKKLDSMSRVHFQGPLTRSIFRLYFLDKKPAWYFSHSSYFIFEAIHDFCFSQVSRVDS